MKFEIAVVGEKKPDLFSRLIMWWMKEKYSHVCIIVDDTTVYHAVEKGVCVEDYSKVFDDKHVCYGRVRVFPDPNKRNDDIAWGYLLGAMEKEYSLTQCLAMAFPPLKPFFKNGQKKAICSEYVAHFLVLGLGLEFAHEDFDFCSPKEVFEFAKLISKKQGVL